MITCPNCRVENPDDVTVCRSCEQPLPADMPSTAPLELDDRDDAGPVVTAEAERPAVAGLATADPSGPATQPLEAPRFGPLPEGAYVAGRYLVQQVQPANGALNLYYVEDTAGVRPCPNPACGFQNNSPEDNFCELCGGALNDVPIYHPPYLVKESNDASLFAVETRLLGMGLSDPSLRLPLSSFHERVGGVERHYVVLPPPATPLSTVSVPREETEVLGWGAALAKGLALLHDREIAFGEINGERIVVDGARIGWTDFSGCVFSGPAGQFVEEVRYLAAWLFYLLTGEQQYTPNVDLPDQLKGLFARAMTSPQPFGAAAEFAAAIEAVQADIRHPTSVDLRVGRRTDVGMVRKLNEDSLLTLDLVWNNRSVSKPLGVYVVADGMGGHAAGEVASGITIQSIAQSTARDLYVPTTTGRSDELDYVEWLKGAVIAANTAVVDRVKATGSDMGTTLVMALVAGDEVHIAHVGDSRAYQVNAHEIRRITTDHSLVERLVATGQITGRGGSLSPAAQRHLPHHRRQAQRRGGHHPYAFGARRPAVALF